MSLFLPWSSPKTIWEPATAPHKHRELIPPQKLVAIEKDDTATLKRLVKFYEQEGYEDKVIEYLYALAEINPKDYETLLRLAKHAENSRRLDDAVDYYQKYLKYAPNSDEKEEVKKRADMLSTGEMIEEQGLLDKLIGFFSKK